jgi:hypothetical protein
MRLKTLLLGSAAAVAFAGGSAQAADLSVAEPVDYVRVCDAFGAGYWYIPGTDTCIKIGGNVTFEATFFDETQLYNSEHTGSWNFNTNWDINVTTKSMTDWGPLVTYINFRSESDDPEADDSNVEANEYYLSIGPVLLGLTQSAFDVVGGGYSWSGFDLSDNKVDQVQLSWAINGFGLVLAVEEPSDRWSTSETNDMPDLVAALSASGTGWDAKVSFLYSDLVADSQIAVEGALEIDVWGDSLLLGALWADDGSGGAGGSSLIVEDGWSVLVSYQHNWSSNLYSAATFRYYDSDDLPGDAWDAAKGRLEGVHGGGGAGLSDPAHRHPGAAAGAGGRTTVPLLNGRAPRSSGDPFYSWHSPESEPEQPEHVVPERQGHDPDEEDEAGLAPPEPLLHRKRASPHAFDGQEYQVPAVQDRNRQEVQDGEVHREERHEL